MLEDGGAVEHLHGDALPGLGVLRELDLGKGALPDGPPDLVLADPAQRPAAAHHLRRLTPPAESRARWGVAPPLEGQGSCSGGRRRQ